MSPFHQQSRSVRDQSRIGAHTAHDPALVSPEGRPVVQPTICRLVDQATALLAAGLLLAGPAVADEVQLPAPALDPTGPVIALWRPSAPASGELQLDWTEGDGHLVERHRITLAEPQAEIAIRIDLRRARAPVNLITARFRPAGSDTETQAEARFFVRPAPGWTQYQVILWQDRACVRHARAAQARDHRNQAVSPPLAGRPGRCGTADGGRAALVHRKLGHRLLRPLSPLDAGALGDLAVRPDQGPAPAESG